MPAGGFLVQLKACIMSAGKAIALQLWIGGPSHVTRHHRIQVRRRSTPPGTRPRRLGHVQIGCVNVIVAGDAMGVVRAREKDWTVL